MKVTLLALCLLLNACISAAVYNKQGSEHCGGNADCRAQQQKEREAAAAMESAIVVDVTEAIVDAVSQEKESTPQPVDPGYQCRNPDDVVICSALDGCYCAEK